MTRFAPPLITLLVTTISLTIPASAHGQTAWYEGFEDPQSSWRPASGNAQFRILKHRRVRTEPHTGHGCEWLTLAGDNGTYVYIAHDVGQPRVIDDLLATVWIKSDRPGLQFGARVVLPRTADPRTGRPVSTLVWGSSYTDAGRWQQLRVDDVPRGLARKVRVLRTQLGPGVDGREAYVESVVLNVYGGPGATSVWIDDLDIAGFVPRQAVGDGPIRPPEVAGGHLSGGNAESARGGQSGDHRIELAGSVLMEDGRPFFPRIIQHQGEPLSLLKQLGFNAIWLKRSASQAILAEAAALDLRLICPPPGSTRPDLPRESLAALGEIPSEYDRVLAWDLGWRLSQQQLDSTRRWARQVRLADRRRSRPLVCQASSDLRNYSRHVDLLLIDRRPLGTSLELADWGNWIRQQPRLARPGTPIWTTVQTQPSAALRRQLAALKADSAPPLSVPSEQIRLLVYTAVASGSRGLLFLSDSPLDGEDPQTRHRAAALELLNLELRLVEPWAAAGSFVADIEGSDPEVRGAVLRTDRARLLLPTWLAPAAQCVPGQSAAHGLSLVVPAVPESSNAYQLTPGGLHPVQHKRVTGGLRVTFEEFGLTGPVLLAQDPLVIDNLTRRSAEIGLRAAQLQRHLAARKLHTVEEVTQRLSGRTATAGVEGGWLSAARKSLQWCDGYLAARNYPAVCLHARRAMRSLRLIERSRWESAMTGVASPLASPATASFAALPWHRRLTDRLGSSQLGPNRVAGGDFEDLSAILRAGWRHFQHPVVGIRTAADLVADAAHSGTTGLRLTARAEDPDNAPALVESPPVWITSPPLPVEAGQVVCISGWVLIPGAITGSVDGLLIVDSLCGEPMAERIGRTAGWQQFILYRVAPRSTVVSVGFYLTGLGEVRLDDVSVQLLPPAGAGNMTRRPAVDRRLR